MNTQPRRASRKKKRADEKEHLANGNGAAGPDPEPDTPVEPEPAITDDEVPMPRRDDDDTIVDSDFPGPVPPQSDDELDDLTYPGMDTAERPGLEQARPTSVSEAHLKSVLESLIFVSDGPVPAKRLARIARSRTKDVERVVGELMSDYRGRGVELIEVAGGYQFRSAAANAPFVREIVQHRPVRLSRAQLETLAIAAYRQPLTRPELDEIRGVDSGSALKVLLERGLLKILGRREDAGRPLLYGTTPGFLEFFGMSTLEELPTLKEFSELSDESRALFARKTGEEIESIGDIELPETPPSEEVGEEEESEAEAREEGHGEAEPAGEPDPQEPQPPVQEASVERALDRSDEIEADEDEEVEADEGLDEDEEEELEDEELDEPDDDE